MALSCRTNWLRRESGVEGMASSTWRMRCLLISPSS